MSGAGAAAPGQRIDSRKGTSGRPIWEGSPSSHVRDDIGWTWEAAEMGAVGGFKEDSGAERKPDGCLVRGKPAVGY